MRTCTIYFIYLIIRIALGLIYWRMRMLNTYCIIYLNRKSANIFTLMLLKIWRFKLKNVLLRVTI